MGRRSVKHPQTSWWKAYSVSCSLAEILPGQLKWKQCEVCKPYRTKPLNTMETRDDPKRDRAEPG